MSSREFANEGSVSLLDAVDHLLNRGAVLVGEATLSLAGVDLVYVGLNLLVSSVQTLSQNGVSSPHIVPVDTRGPSAAAVRSVREPSLMAEQGSVRAVHTTDVWDAPASPAASSDRACAPGQRVDSGLAQLVLTLVELLRQLLERQAVRRMEGDGLTEEQAERIGLALRDLATTMRDLCATFGLRQEDLNLDLGPLGPLLDNVR